MRRFAFPAIAATLSAALMATTPAFAFGDGGGHGGGGGFHGGAFSSGGFHGGGFHGSSFHGGGWHRGGWHGGGGAWPLYAGAGLGLGLLGAESYYGYPYGYPSYYGAYPDSYGYNYPYSAAPVTAYSTVPASGAPGLMTGRSAATGQMGDYCTTPVKTCELYHTSIVGGGCSCKVAGGRSHGSVTP